jgi:hypothetical protein
MPTCARNSQLRAFQLCLASSTIVMSLAWLTPCDLLLQGMQASELQDPQDTRLCVSNISLRPSFAAFCASTNMLRSSLRSIIQLSSFLFHFHCSLACLPLLAIHLEHHLDWNATHFNINTKLLSSWYKSSRNSKYASHFCSFLRISKQCSNINWPSSLWSSSLINLHCPIL